MQAKKMAYDGSIMDSASNLVSFIDLARNTNWSFIEL